MISYKDHLKKITISEETRWFIKRDAKGKIKEVKQVYDPEEYLKTKNPRELLNKEELISILEGSTI